MKNIETNVSIQTKKIDETGAIKGTSTGIAMALAYLFGFLDVYAGLYLRSPGDERRN